ncbi:UvrABC system protein C [Candidatus Arthromitus sp. SFB-2]|nr:UvrABC system protein C [Candidatus Arthromitus sp. SFB-2]
MFDIKYNISILPESPGVYIMKDSNTNVIYIGKAKNLKKRVSQYFRKTQNHSEKTRSLVKNILEFEYIVTENEIEALILEDSLIKKYQPKYNILLKDDKTYPFIKITTNEDFPRIFSTKNYIKDGNLYFGPFTSMNSVNEIISLVKSYFLIRNCKIHIKDGVISCRPCIYYQTKRCKAPCYGLISKIEYNEMIKEIIDILSGKSKDSILNLLKNQMLRHSENLEYEQAMSIRDKIEGIKLIFEKQSIFFWEREL